ncbi:hypothetical protein Tco_0015593 [Tanacetum coccineum]
MKIPIIRKDLEEEPAPTGETSAPLTPKTAKQLVAKRNQERVKSILLLEIPDEYLPNQLEVHGAPISKEDINEKFLRSLLPSWNQIALIMRNKSDIDEIDIDDLYNNLRNTTDTNEVSTASGDFGVSTAGGTSQVPSTLCAHDVAYSFFAQPTTSPQLENEDFQQIDGDDLEELDLRWQVAMLTVKVKKSRRNQGKRSYGDNGRSNAPTNESSSQELVAQDGLESYDWSNDFEIEPVNYALMAISSSSSSSSSDNEGYELALESLESRILVHKKNELALGEKYKELLTPRADISFGGLDEYAIRKKIIKSKTTDLNIKTSEIVGKTNEVNTQKPKTVYESVNRDKVIIKDWNSDDEDDVSEVQDIRHKFRRFNFFIKFVILSFLHQ